MDGTLTKPSMDFQTMRRRLDIMQGDVLEVIAAMPEPQRAQASTILRAFEIESLAHMDVMPGAVDVCRLLDHHSVPRCAL